MDDRRAGPPHMGGPAPTGQPHRHSPLGETWASGREEGRDHHNSCDQMDDTTTRPDRAAPPSPQLWPLRSADFHDHYEELLSPVAFDDSHRAERCFDLPLDGRRYDNSLRRLPPCRCHCLPPEVRVAPRGARRHNRRAADPAFASPGRRRLPPQPSRNGVVLAPRGDLDLRKLVGGVFGPQGHWYSPYSRARPSPRHQACGLCSGVRLHAPRSGLVVRHG